MARSLGQQGLNRSPRFPPPPPRPPEPKPPKPKRGLLTEHQVFKPDPNAYRWKPSTEPVEESNDAMPSSKNSPGPHDRKPGPPRTCKAQTRAGVPCTRKTWHGPSGLCKNHYQLNLARMQGAPAKPHSNPRSARERTKREEQTEELAGEVKETIGDIMEAYKHPKSVTDFVVSNQALAALGRLRAFDPASARKPGFDPKIVLLDNVRSAWEQRQVWEALLASIPIEDYGYIGVLPLPGSANSSRGARIEVIQKNLLEATKVAARLSKMAIDAGIEERLVRIAEEQAALIADTVRAGVIAAIASIANFLTEAQREMALNAALASAGSHLRALAAGGEDIIEGVAKVVAQSDEAFAAAQPSPGGRVDQATTSSTPEAVPVPLQAPANRKTVARRTRPRVRREY